MAIDPYAPPGARLVEEPEPVATVIAPVARRTDIYAPPNGVLNSGASATVFGQPGQRGGTVVPRGYQQRVAWMRNLERRDAARATAMKDFMRRAGEALGVNLDPNNRDFEQNLRNVQKQLRAAGLDVGTNNPNGDGMLGPKTAAAIEQFIANRPAATVAHDPTAVNPAIPTDDPYAPPGARRVAVAAAVTPTASRPAVAAPDPYAPPLGRPT